VTSGIACQLWLAAGEAPRVHRTGALNVMVHPSIGGITPSPAPLQRDAPSDSFSFFPIDSWAT